MLGKMSAARKALVTVQWMEGWKDSPKVMRMVARLAPKSALPSVLWKVPSLAVRMVARRALARARG